VGRALREVGLIHDGFTETELQQLRETLHGERAPSFDILDAYCAEPPSPQTALDIFAGEWASRVPVDGTHSGHAPLFEIEHVPWGVAALGGIDGQRVLELGPLEGGHTYLLDRMGAGEVVAVEANTRAYLKCLIAKELLGMPAARFLCGDAVRYLEQAVLRGERFDLCLASGILYHLKDPVAALDLMSRVSDRLILWTMYYDGRYIATGPDLAPKFPGGTSAVHNGFEHTLWRQEYQGALDDRGFRGGSAAHSAWMSRGDLFRAVDHVGFDVIDVGFEEQNHKGNGPCICIAARRRSV